jgi:iron complex transport system substrate-binding protein
MFHCGVMPSYRRWCEGFGLAVTLLGLATTAAVAQPRIASINLCTDQLLMTLADPDQILGLSPYARDVARSWDAKRAAQFPLLSGGAEDVLVLKPDIVVAGRFTKRATRQLLKDKGQRVIEFDVPRSLDDVRQQIMRMGALVQHPERATAEIGRLDAAIERARGVAARKSFSVLALSRRGWVSGSDSLSAALLSAVGLRSAADGLGLRTGGFASLEAIVSLKPDYLLVSDSGDYAEDEGRAFLLHPALERFYPASKRIMLPERLLACGGPMLTEALDRLAAELERIDR